MAQFDIAILGAGPVGMALARALSVISQHKLKIALFQAKSPNINPQTDKRVLALNYGSQVLLEKYQIWPKHIAPIQTVHVSQKGRLGRTLIRPEDLGVPTLGACVGYADLWTTMKSQLEQVQLFEGEFAQASDAGTYAIISQGDQEYTAQIAVQCDGRQSHDIEREYRQYALITSAKAQFPREHWAWERFTTEGPLAVLPHPILQGSQSIVWSTSPEKAQSLMQLSDDVFSDRLTAHFGDRLGRLEVNDHRVIFPLALRASSQLVRGRTVILGNAAQTMHPVAGQGLNLGLRDVGGLINCLTPWALCPSADPSPYLASFEAIRYRDRRLTWRLTDTLARIFTTRHPWIEHACGLSLLGLDLIPPAREVLARHLLQGYRP